MRKILLILIVSCMALTTVACGAISEGESKDHSSTSSNFNKKEGFEIYEGTKFYDGVAFVDVRNEDGEVVVVGINKSGEILCELEECYSTIALSDFQNGIVVFENIAYNKEGKVIASPEKSGYDEICYNGAGNFTESGPALGNKDGHIIVKKFEESYAGARTLFGVIDNEGKWEIPLSENGQWECGKIIYTWESGRLQEYTTSYTTKEYIRQIDTYEINRRGHAIYKQEKGESTLVLEDYSGDYFMDAVFIGRQEQWDEQGNYLKTKYMLYDYKGNALLDLSEYEERIPIDTTLSHQGPDYKNGYLLFEAHNNNGSYYLFLLNNQGQFVYEPIKVENSDKCYGLNEKGFVLKKDNIYYLYEYNGNIVQYDEKIYSLSEFSDGVALVEDVFSRKMYINYQGEVIIEQIVKD